MIGLLISIITFPGVIVHELAHHLFCKFFRVAVFEVKYFQIGNPCGYVLHEEPKKDWQTLLIAIGPFFVNTILGILIAGPVMFTYFEMGSDTFDVIQVWIGVSIAMHSFPSIGDAKSILKIAKKKETSIFVKLIGAPIIVFIYLLSIGSVFWLDLVYGILIVNFLPEILIKVLV